MFKKTVIFLVGILLTLALIMGSGCSPKQEAKKNVNEAQQKTSNVVDNRTMTTWAKEDKYKNGCADCHKKGDAKTSLKAKVAGFGEHPTVPDDVTIKTCLNCHKKSPEALSKITNRLHKAHGNSSSFRPKYNGSCVSCHGLKDNGEIYIKGAE